LRILFMSLLISSNTWALTAPQQEKLYECAHLDERSVVERIFISKISLGRNIYYETEVKISIRGIESSYFTRVNMLSSYGGRVLHFTNGNHRIKIDKVRVKEGKYWAFARIPKYDIHSFDWNCKDWN
jgi:hypothetical protein